MTEPHNDLISAQDEVNASCAGIAPFICHGLIGLHS